MAIHSTGIIRAKSLRKNASDAERILWSAIRNNKTGFQFRRQHKIGPYYADFVCIEKRLVVELDGDQHGTDTAIAYDNKRTDFIKSHAWNIVRISNYYVYKELDNVVFCLVLILTGAEHIKDIEIFKEKYN